MPKQTESMRRIGFLTPARVPCRRSGCLIGYGQNVAEFHRVSAYDVTKILKGAQPADLPVAQPTKFDLTINLKTAKSLSIEMPQALLATADEVIE